MRYHCTPFRITKLQNLDNIKCWWGCGAKGNIIHWCRMQNDIHVLEESLLFSFKIKHVLIICLKIMLFGIYPNKLKTSAQFSSVTQSCLTLCDPMNHSTPGLPVHHQLLEFTQTHVHRSQWCHPAISSSVVPFSSCPQSLPASESFPMSQPPVKHHR